jgi:hypothetical protein
MCCRPSVRRCRQMVLGLGLGLWVRDAECGVSERLVDCCPGVGKRASWMDWESTACRPNNRNCSKQRHETACAANWRDGVVFCCRYSESERWLSPCCYAARLEDSMLPWQTALIGGAAGPPKLKRLLRQRARLSPRGAAPNECVRVWRTVGEER